MPSRASRASRTPPVALDPRRRAAIRQRLLDWYVKERRDLPWRRTRDPYRILVSETMLQQTRVETVIPFYERFTERFPSVHALADADEQEVLHAWAGLGYYARARNLRRAAETIVREHDGRVPRSAVELAALPGVGRYTAGALRSIAFDEPAPIVDGNVKRVTARLLAEASLGAEAYWQVAQQLAEGERPGDLNQALMELGATLCTPRAPLCARCPLRSLCRGKNAPEQYPAPAARRTPRPVRAVAGVLLRRRDGGVLMLRRPSRGLLGGLWELPAVESDSPEALPPAVRERTGLEVGLGEPLGRVRHVFTHRTLDLAIHRLDRTRGRLSADPGQARWCVPAALDELPLSKLTRKVLAASGL